MVNETDLGLAAWRKGLRSGSGENCVEVARVRDVYAVRDSKNPSGPALVLSPHDWRALTDELKNGAYDL